MLSKNPFTLNNLNDILNKPLYFFEDNRLNVSNIIDPDDLHFFDEYYGELYDEIVYYEYDKPLCQDCENLMNSNGSRRANQINGKEYVKNNIFVQYVEKHIIQI